MGVFLGVEQLVFSVELSVLDASLRQQQLLLREPLPDHPQSFEVVTAVPVECHACHHGHGLVIQDRLSPLQRPLFIVIPDIDLDIRQALGLQRRPHKVPEEPFFLLGGVDTGVPGLDRLGFILKGQHGDPESPAPESPDIPADILRPAPPIGLLQFSPMIPFPVGFHVGRRTPGGEHDLQLSAVAGLRVPEHGKDVGFHPLKGKIPKFFVRLIPVRLIVRQGEITAVDGNSHKAVFHGPGAKIGIQHLLFLRRVHQRIDIGRGVRDGSAEALHGLIDCLGIEIDELFLSSSVVQKRRHRFRGLPDALRIDGGYQPQNSVCLFFHNATSRFAVSIF